MTFIIIMLKYYWTSFLFPIGEMRKLYFIKKGVSTMANMDTTESGSSKKNRETTTVSVSRSKLIFRAKTAEEIQAAWDKIKHDGFSISIAEIKSKNIVTATILPFTYTLSPEDKPTMAQLYMPGFNGSIDDFIEEHFMAIKKAVNKACCLSILKRKEDGEVYVFLGTDSRAIEKGDGERAFSYCYKKIIQLFVENYEQADIRSFTPARKMDEISMLLSEALATS